MLYKAVSEEAIVLDDDRGVLSIIAKTMKLFLVVCVLAVIIQAHQSNADKKKHRCPSNQKWFKCKPCRWQCKQRRDNWNCPCRKGCACDDGKLWNGDKCVRPRRCQKECNRYKNEIWTRCASSCDATCKRPHKPCSRDNKCVRRCACPDHYVRDKHDVCVRKRKCEPKKKCNRYKNEIWTRCASSCDATCKRPHKPCSRDNKCVRRCACPDHYVRDKHDVCVRKRKCERKQKNCPKNQVYNPCVYCVPKCNDLLWTTYFCRTYHCEPKCTCTHGLVMNGNGKCVPKSHCFLHHG